MLDTKNHPLVATIYAMTLSPQGFDALAGDLETQVSELVLALTGEGEIPATLAPGQRSVLGLPGFSQLAGHIDSARRIQAHVRPPGQDVPLDWRIDYMLDLLPSPAAVFDADERILRANAAVTAFDQGSGALLQALISDNVALAEIRRAIATLGTDASIAAVPVNRGAARGSTSCAIVQQISDGDQDTPLYMISVADCTFDNSVETALKAAYGLTGAEAAVAVLLAGGARAEEIASHRGVSPPTVRSQIRAIKAKTHVRDLSDLVRLLCGFAIGTAVQRLKLPASGSGTKTWSSRGFKLPDGRRLDWLTQGDPDGAPVLLFHNLPDGVLLPAAADAYARRNSLRIITPYRSGHGYSDPLPDGLQGMAYFDQVADDFAALSEHLSLGKARLLGRAGGANFATRFAVRYPELTSAIVMVGHAPMWYPERFWRLPQRYRAQWLVNKHMPELGLLFANTLMPKLDLAGHTGFAKQLCGDSPPDLEVLDNPEYAALLWRDKQMGMRQGPETHAREALLIELDMSDDAKALPHPLHLIHGAQDRVLTPDFSREFARAVPQTRLEIMPDAGYYLFYSHWRRVMDALIAAGETG